MHAVKIRPNNRSNNATAPTIVFVESENKITIMVGQNELCVIDLEATIDAGGFENHWVHFHHRLGMNKEFSVFSHKFVNQDDTDDEDVS